MDQKTIIAGWEARCAELEISIAAMCREADIHPTTFSRWKDESGKFSISFSSMNKINAALERIAQAAAA